MKGIELSTSTIIKIVILIVVLGIIIWFVYFYVYNYYLPRYTTESRIAQLCPEWVEKQCTKPAAEADLSISVDGTPVYLSQLCAKFFEGDKYATWTDELWEKCKKKCIGCP